MRPVLLMPLSYFCCLRFIIFYSRCCLMVTGEFYSSVDRLKTLVSMEAKYIDVYKQHFDTQKQDIKVVQRYINDVKVRHELAKKDVAAYFANPINAFTLIKRMVTDWHELLAFLQFSRVNSKSYKNIQPSKSATKFIKEIQKLGNRELSGSVQGLIRLQTVYQISTADMASGKKYGNPPDWSDCFEIGAIMLENKLYKLATEWLSLSLLKVQESEQSNSLGSSFINRIKEHLAYAHHGMGDYKSSLKYLDDIIESEPESAAKLNKEILMHLKSIISDNGAEIKKYYKDYDRLCRGERIQKMYKLNCNMDSKLHPYFILSPLKVEPLLLNPPITLYYDVVTDKQISELWASTHNRLQRSSVIDSNRSVVKELRVSQQIWVDLSQSRVAEMIYKYVGAITGLNMTNSESLQVANYGIGGQYESHYDFLPEGYESSLLGNRLSTNLLYLSDVEEGGHTVFPQLDVYVKPIKGAMVIWYNLHKSLDPDRRMMHAGCPVVKGNKKIANIWVHAGDQELQRPCGLIDDGIRE